VSRTFCSKGNEERSKTIMSNPAFTASIAFASEWVWSALRKMGKSNSSRRLRTHAASCRVPTKARSPSEAPTNTGTLSSRADAKTAFSKTRSATLKWPTAAPDSCACARIFCNWCMMHSFLDISRNEGREMKAQETKCHCLFISHPSSLLCQLFLCRRHDLVRLEAEFSLEFLERR